MKKPGLGNRRELALGVLHGELNPRSSAEVEVLDADRIVARRQLDVGGFVLHHLFRRRTRVVDDKLVADVQARTVVRAQRQRMRPRFLDAQIPRPHRAEIHRQLGPVELPLGRAEVDLLIHAPVVRLLGVREIFEPRHFLVVLANQPVHSRLVHLLRRHHRLRRRRRLSPVDHANVAEAHVRRGIVILKADVSRARRLVAGVLVDQLVVQLDPVVGPDDGNLVLVPFPHRLTRQLAGVLAVVDRAGLVPFLDVADLDFVPLLHRGHRIVSGIGKTHEDARVVLRARDLELQQQREIAQLLLLPQQTHPAFGLELAVLDDKRPRPGVLPAGQVFAVEQRDLIRGANGGDADDDAHSKS